jgi:Fe-S oxidoreductase
MRRDRIMTTAYTYKPWLVEKWKDDWVPEEVAIDCYATFACRHKFCREVCPVYQETGNESHVSYGFHVALLSVSRGYEKLHNLGNTFTYCLQCGACQLRCPNTLFTGDFYRITNEHNVLVTKTRNELLRLGFKFKGSDDMLKAINQIVKDTEEARLSLTEWAKDLDLPRYGETILFTDYFMATQMTNILRLIAKILKVAGIKFGIIENPKPALPYELDYLGEKGIQYIKENIEALKKAGAKTVIVPDPHVYVSLTKEYPRLTGSEVPFDVVFVTDYIWNLIKEGKLVPKKPVNKKVTYHDPCMLNKVSGIWESPRNILKSIPGIEFIDEDHVTQWYYCCGNGASEARTFKILHEDLSYRIGLKRLNRALDTGAKTLAVACPHCNEQFNEVKLKSKTEIEILDIFEILAESLEIR